MRRYFEEVRMLDEGRITPGEFARLVTGADGWWDVAAAFQSIGKMVVKATQMLFTRRLYRNWISRFLSWQKE